MPISGHAVRNTDGPIDVLIFVTSDPRYDTRSSKFLKSLLDAGYNARVIGVASDGNPETSASVVRMRVEARSGKRFFLQFYRGAISNALESKARIVVAGDLFSLLPAIVNKKKYSKKDLKVKLVYDSKELYEELPSLKKKKTSFLFWRLVERASIRYIDSVLTVNESIAKILKSNWRLPTTVVMNVPSRVELPLITARKLEIVYLAFSGGLQPGRGLHQLLDLLAILPEKYKLRFVGDGSMRSELELKCKSMKLQDRVSFVGRVKSSEVVNELAKSHLGIYLMENTGLCHYLSLPNKLFQFIMARLPVIVPKFPEMERIVETYGVGVAVDTSDLNEVAQKIMEMTNSEDNYSRFIRNCQDAASKLNWENEKNNFLDVIRN